MGLRLSELAQRSQDRLAHPLQEEGARAGKDKHAKRALCVERKSEGSGEHTQDKLGRLCEWL